MLRLVPNKFIRTPYIHFQRPGSQIPNISRLRTNLEKPVKKRFEDVRCSLSVLGLIGGTSLALATALRQAEMSSKELNVATKPEVSNTDNKQAELKSKEEQSSRDKIDEWDQLICLVNSAIKLRDLKEQLLVIKKMEEAELKRSVAEDQSLEAQANSVFKKREKELQNQYSKDMTAMVEREQAEVRRKSEHSLAMLHRNFSVELEQAIITQRYNMAQEMAKKFTNLRSEAQQTIIDVEKVFKTKHANLKKQESILHENQVMLNLRNQCREFEKLLVAEPNASKTWMQKLYPLTKLMKSMEPLVVGNNEMVKAVLNTFPEEAIERGILSEVALKERFANVEPIAHRLSLLRNDGPYSGTMYLTSYIRSIFTLQPTYHNIYSHGRAIEDMDNSELLYRARQSIDDNDLVQAVKYLEHLQGAARHAISGWLQEAEMMLKLRLATRVLQNYATLQIYRSALN